MQKWDQSKALFEWSFNLDKHPERKGIVISARLWVRVWGTWAPLYSDGREMLGTYYQVNPHWFSTHEYNVVIHTVPGAIEEVKIYNEWDGFKDRPVGLSRRKERTIVNKPGKRFSQDPMEAWFLGVPGLRWREKKADLYLLEDWFMDNFDRDRVKGIMDWILKDMMTQSLPI